MWASQLAETAPLAAAFSFPLSSSVVVAGTEMSSVEVIAISVTVCAKERDTVPDWSKFGSPWGGGRVPNWDKGVDGEPLSGAAAVEMTVLKMEVGGNNEGMVVERGVLTGGGRGGRREGRGGGG